MCPDLSLFPLFLEAAIAAFSILGGIMATASGSLAAIAAYRPAWTKWALADAVNRGIAAGFIAGLVPAAGALIMAVNR